MTASKTKRGLGLFLGSIFTRDAKRTRRRVRSTGAPRGSNSDTTVPLVLGPDRIYVVGVGDSWSKIAEETLGDPDRWPEILEANREQTEDEGLVRVGQKLYIPEE